MGGGGAVARAGAVFVVVVLMVAVKAVKSVVADLAKNSSDKAKE